MHAINRRRFSLGAVAATVAAALGIKPALADERTSHTEPPPNGLTLKELEAALEGIWEKTGPPSIIISYSRYDRLRELLEVE